MQYKAGFILEAVREKLLVFSEELEDGHLKIDGLLESLCSFDCLLLSIWIIQRLRISILY